MRAIILGSGGSSGTPAIDAGWGRCDPGDQRNRRTRPSLLVEEGDCRILVDTSPDLREQLLAAGVCTLSAVIYTHAHADHLHGIDDLRAINRVIGTALDVFADGETLSEIHSRFPYVFEPLRGDGKFFYKPSLVPHVLSDGDHLRIDRIDVWAFEQDHGFSTTLGLRFGRLAYTTDVVSLSERAFAVLEGIDTWVIGTLVDKPHPTHCHVDKALAWIERIRPRQAALTHLGLELDHAELEARLPPWVRAGFDGMVLDVL
jgi:phosphoribosyl 1,2-cyclic phosphate phosphodiesterase